MNNKTYHDRAWLIQQYYDLGKSMREIARKCDASYWAIRCAMNKFGLNRRPDWQILQSPWVCEKRRITLQSSSGRAKNRSSHIGLCTGEKNHNWKGGIRHGGGYEFIHTGPFYISVHRQNMERMLGRKLKKGEIVHHVHGIKMDNRIENLALCSNQKAHRWAHSEEARVFLGDI